MIWFLELVVINTNFLHPFEKVFKDFRYTDILYSKIRGTEYRPSKEIFLVNIDTLGRSGIAKELEIIARYHPKVVGLDVVFIERRDSITDSFLKEKLASIPNLVIPRFSEIRGKDLIDSIQMNPYFGNFCAGYVNFSGNDKRTSTVRNYYPLLNGNQKTIRSFSAEVVRLYDQKKYDKLIKKQNHKEIINYSGNFGNFPHFSSVDVLKNEERLKEIEGKIVLVGFFSDNDISGSFEDKYFTPCNPEITGRTWPDMYGLVIHANAISMILDANYIHKVPLIVEIIMTILVCYFIISIYSSLYVKHSKWFHPVGKIIQLAFLILIIFIAFWLYEYFNILYETTLLIVVVVLSMDLLYFYEGLMKLLNRWFGVKSYFIHEHH